MKLSKGKKILLIIVIAGAIIGLGSGFYFVQASKKPAFCNTCHIMKPYYQSWSDSNLLAHKHEQKGVTCQDCHHETYMEKAKEGITYVTGQYQTPLPELKVPQQECLKCHESYAKVAELTKNVDHNPHASPHYVNLECNVCHKMHKPSQVYCAQCHTLKWNIK